MSNNVENNGLLQRLADAFKRTHAMVWVGMGSAFLVLGTLRQAPVFMGIGAALLAVGLTAHKRSR
jgi:multisubunit Na+/H+ antiporter MnhG subunit